MPFPPDSIQSYIEPSEWWVETDSKSVKRGFLLKAFLPHVDQIPYTINPTGRKDPNIHDKAMVKIHPLDMKRPRTRGDLPVAAMTLHEREIWSAYRAKKRPCLVLGRSRKKVEQIHRSGMPQKSTSQTLLVAPYYGADQDGMRAGYPSKFVDAVKHTVYPQFFVDMLPLSGSDFSMMRFDQIQPVGRISNSYEFTGYRLSQEALDIVDDLFDLFLHDSVDPESELHGYQELIKAEFYS